MEPILSVSHLQKVYGDRGSHTRALDDLSFDVLPGEFVGVMGASGSGKTTLLNCVSTIDRPSSGTITVDGTDVTALRGKALSRFRRERLGFVFQDCNLLDTLTAFENIALALTILGTPAGEIDRRVRDTAGLLGLERVLESTPNQLSGGEQQRVGPPPGHHHRPRPHPGRRAHRRTGLQVRRAASGPALPAQPGAGGHHRHGHPRRLHRLLVSSHPLHQGRPALARAAAGRGGPAAVLPGHHRRGQPAGR